MIRILITGFEPFNGYERNLSWDAVRELPKALTYKEEEVRIYKECLPVDYEQAGERLKQLLAQTLFDIVVCVGQAAGDTGVCPEKIGINWMRASIPDNRGQIITDGRKIRYDGQDGYFSTLPVEEIVSAMKAAGIEASVSYSAGTYVCNCVMYSLLYELKKSGRDRDVLAGFIHVPCTNDRLAPEVIPVPKLTEALVIALSCSVKQVLKNRMMERFIEEDKELLNRLALDD